MPPPTATRTASSAGACSSNSIATVPCPCIVCGWYLKSYVQAIAACRTRGIKVLVLAEADEMLAFKDEKRMLELARTRADSLF